MNKLTDIERIVYVDVDDTTLDLHGEWVTNRYNNDYNDNLTRRDVKTWELHKFVKPECGRKIYDYLNDPDLYKSVKPLPGAIEGIEKIRSLGWRVIFLTAYFNTPKIEALHNYGLLKEYPYNDGRWHTACDVVMANDKTLLKGDMLIDDKTDNIEKFGKGLIFDQPWNQDCNFPRVYNWYDDNTFKYFEQEFDYVKVNSN